MTRNPIETSTNTQAGPAQRAIRTFFRAAAVIEAFTWAGLLIAMIIKYPLQGSPMGVTVFGWFHGAAWITFIIASIASSIRFRWPVWAFLLGLLMSVLPFLTVPYDIWMERSGRLGQRRTKANPQ